MSIEINAAYHANTAAKARKLAAQMRRAAPAVEIGVWEYTGYDARPEDRFFACQPQPQFSDVDHTCIEAPRSFGRAR